MTQRFTRIIRRPQDCSDEQWLKLKTELGVAAQRQRELADRAPHVLRFTGDIQECEDGTAYVIEHEPASALPIGGLFDRSAPALQSAQLLRVSSAVFEALKSAHTASGTPAIIHGGLCPGVLVFAPDGTAKLTDFGFAPGVCTALGEDAYVNLAVESARLEASGDQVTAVWEVLSRDEFERDGRICAFIDPEKYGGQSLGAFETSSDVIAAAFVLHLLAEHQHPYLPDEPGAHRLVEMSEFMAMGRFNGSRRKDLRTSSDVGTQKWCDLMVKALSRLPQGRPTAADLADKLAEHIKPEDESDALRHQLDEIEAHARENAWDKVQLAARSLAENPAAPTDVVQRANALAAHAEAAVLIAQAENSLVSTDWHDAKTPIERVLAMSGVSAELVNRAKKAQTTLSASVAARHIVEDVEARLTADDLADPQLPDSERQSSAYDPFAAVEVLQALEDRLNEIRNPDELVVPMRNSVQQAREDVSRRLREALPAAEAAMGSDKTAADEWLQALESAAGDCGPASESQDWEKLRQLLADKPALRFWPEHVTARAEALQRRLDDHRAQLQQQEAIQSDHATAELWADQVRLAVGAQRWDRAGQLLDERPSVEHWPDGLLAEIEAIAEEIKVARHRQSDERQAREWCAKIRQAVQDGDEPTGAELLAERPELDHWPQDVLEEVGRYESQLAKWIEEAHARKAQEEEQRQLVEDWLRRANTAAKNEQWDEALRIIEAPPPGETANADSLAQMQELRKTCQARLQDEAKDRAKAQRAAILMLARDFVRGVSSAAFADVLHPDLLSVVLETGATGDSETLRDWDVRVTLDIPRDTLANEENPACFPFHFQVDDGERRIRDTDDALAGMVRNNLHDLLADLQRSGANRLTTDLRDGLFPNAEVTILPGEPVATLPATIRLLGGDTAEGVVKTELSWDSRRLLWRYASPRDFVRDALHVARTAIRAELEESLIAGVASLRTNRSLLVFDVALPAVHELDVLPSSFDSEGSLAIGPGKHAEPQTLQTFPIHCSQLGQAECHADVTPAAQALDEIILQAQRNSLADVRDELQARIEDAGIKAKIAATPKRIDRLTDKVTFLVTAKDHDDLPLPATWDLDRFAYHLQDRWDRPLEEFFGVSLGEAEGENATLAAPVASGRALRRFRRKATTVFAALAAVTLISMVWALWPENNPPTAVAIAPQQVTEGQQVKLDASGSRDPEKQRVTFAWTQDGEPSVELSDPQAAKPTFTAPACKPDCTLTFVVRVSDGVYDDSATVSIVVSSINRPPIANAGEDQHDVMEGTDVTLNGSDSHDPEGAELVYTWTHVGGPTVSLQGDDTATPHFTAPDVLGEETITFAIVVSDGAHETEDRVQVFIIPEPEKPDPIAPLLTGFQNLDGQFAKLRDRLTNPSHADLEVIIQDNGISPLIAQFETFRKTVPTDLSEATERQAASRLIGDVEQHLTDLRGFQERLNNYAGILTLEGKTVDEQIALVDTAQKAWPTQDATDLLAVLRAVRKPMTLANGFLDEGQWREARFFMGKVRNEHANILARADPTPLQETLAQSTTGWVDALEQELSAYRRKQLEPALRIAAEWVQENPAPDDPFVLLTKAAQATDARMLLDQLDLDVASAMLSADSPQDETQPLTRQPLLVSDDLTDNERATVSALLRWVTATIPIGDGDAASEHMIRVAFIPSSEDDDVLDPVWMSQTEVTLGLYRKIIGRVPRRQETEANTRIPVGYVTANDAREFCTGLADTLQHDLTVRIPTVAEWTRAFGSGRQGNDGSPGQLTFGEDGRPLLDRTRANFISDEGYDLAAPGHEDGFGEHAPVGSYPPNRWGLFDMLGNVSEWVSPHVGGRPEFIGDSFKDPWHGSHFEPVAESRGVVREDVGMRIVILPPP